MSGEIGFKLQQSVTDIIRTGIDLIDILTIYILIYITIGPAACGVKIINFFLKHGSIFIDSTP